MFVVEKQINEEKKHIVRLLLRSPNLFKLFHPEQKPHFYQHTELKISMIKNNQLLLHYNATKKYKFKQKKMSAKENHSYLTL